MYKIILTFNEACIFKNVYLAVVNINSGIRNGKHENFP